MALADASVEVLTAVLDDRVVEAQAVPECFRLTAYEGAVAVDLVPAPVAVLMVDPVSIALVCVILVLARFPQELILCP